MIYSTRLTKLSRYTENELDRCRRYLQSNAPEKLKAYINYAPETDRQILDFHGRSDYQEIRQAVNGADKDQGIVIHMFQQDRYLAPDVHRHDFYEMIYVLEGEITIEADGNLQPMENGDICFLAPGTDHAVSVFNRSVVLILHFQAQGIREMCYQLFKENHLFTDFFMDNTYTQNVYDMLLFHTSGDMGILDCIDRMCSMKMESHPLSQGMMQLTLLQLMGELIMNYQDTAVSHYRKKKRDQQDYDILRFIDEHYQTVSLGMLEEEFHFSGNYITQRIRVITGGSFMDYLQSIRMRHAAEMLTTGNVKIKDISYALGYNNQEHFIRTFRKYYGQTPTRYRNQYYRGDTD